MELALELKKKKLLYCISRRGTKELSSILISILGERIQRATITEIKQYEDLMQLDDPDLYAVMTAGSASIPQ